ncbi:MAG: DNA (cytosine-5-)-methyltransferase [Candidatus Lutacidiplasmatales archaeon]
MSRVTAELDTRTYVGCAIPPSSPRARFPVGSEEASHLAFLDRHLKEVEEILRGQYGRPTHGNKESVADELVYIMLSRRTRERAYTRAYDRLKGAYPTWDQAISMAENAFVEKVRDSGLANRRAGAIRANLAALSDAFGSADGADLSRWSDRRLFRYLASLPEVGPKSALCVMMYSLGRRVFPVDTHVLRVLRRLGYLGPGVNHKLAQRLLARRFPANLRQSLHVTLVAHGRELCLPARPKCEQCPVQRFCHFARSRARVRSQNTESQQDRVVDLFAGAGGMSTGFESAGFRAVAAVEASQLAVDTYYLNHPGVEWSQIIRSDIRRVTPERILSAAGGPITGIVGGPPCQGFSLVGKEGRRGLERARPSSRNRLYESFVRAVREIQPAFFVMENVPHISAHRKGKFLAKVTSEFELAGYTASAVHLRSEEHGVPQVRKRIMVVGFRGADESAARRLAEFRSRVAVGGAQHEIHALASAISDLPPLGRGEGTFYARLAKHPVRPEGPDRVRGVFNHVARYHMDRDVELFGLLAPGETAWDALHVHRAVHLMPYVKRGPDGSPMLGSDGLPVLEGFRDKFRKLRADRPSPTIMAHMSKDANMYIHPNQSRALTVREAARVQSFDDEFIFLGGISQQFTLVGNAVPPRLAAGVARAVSTALALPGTPPERSPSGGTLASHPPTKPVGDRYAPSAGSSS